MCDDSPLRRPADELASFAGHQVGIIRFSVEASSKHSAPTIVVSPDRSAYDVGMFERHE
ncbi:hypothetical protein ABZ468_36865 [Streptomyces sp. NPDC005708]|uniref:hypothetical protein n=1 Tax=unclassified Streptomyces TaxID=2593676 RepID=UPI0033D7E627